MSTGRSIVSTCPARAALAGNPSDGYGGAVLATTVPDLVAFASIEASPDFSVRADGDLSPMLRAAADEFRAVAGPIRSGTLSATTTIPRSVGLGGSSALVIAALRALAESTGYRWKPIELAEAALRTERNRLGIEAGLQDRLVQAVAEPVMMEFDPVGYHTVVCPVDLPLFVAWSSDGAESSDTLHRSLRRRFDGGDAHVRTSMAGLAQQARQGGAAMNRGDLRGLAAAVNRTFEIRALMVDIDPTTLELAEIGRRAGAAVNTAGSGGSVIGLVPTIDHLGAVTDAYAASGHDVITVGR